MVGHLLADRHVRQHHQSSVIHANMTAAHRSPSDRQNPLQRPKVKIDKAREGQEVMRITNDRARRAMPTTTTTSTPPPNDQQHQKHPTW